MKRFTTIGAPDLRQAVAASAGARARGESASYAGGGSDLLGMMKDRLATPDVVVYLKSIKGLDAIARGPKGTTIGGLATLDSISRDAGLRRDYAVLAQAAETVATPQIRNVATIAGNVCQRPWCWYYRNGFKCFKNGGNTCFSASGENAFHAIFGGGPSYIVHPSDTAPALVALDAQFRLTGPGGSRTVPAGEFFVLPKQDAARENVLQPDEALAEVVLPPAARGTRSAYHKVMDREAWTHALVSAAVVVHVNDDAVRSARIVLGGVAPIPWRVPAAEKILEGKRITPELAAAAADAAVQDANPLSKNGYKVPMTRALVQRAIESVM